MLFGTLSLGLLGGGGAPAILFSASPLTDADTDEVAGTASVRGAAGTPQYTISGGDAASFSMDINTGVMTEVGTLTAGTYNTTISVSGVSPSLSDLPVTITVAVSGAEALPYYTAVFGMAA